MSPATWKEKNGFVAIFQKSAVEELTKQLLPSFLSFVKPQEQNKGKLMRPKKLPPKNADGKNLVILLKIVPQDKGLVADFNML